MTDRPDPLAPPEGYDEPANEEAGPDLTVCSAWLGTAHCAEPVTVVLWVGCMQEHVGPMAFCVKHEGYMNEWAGRLTCTPCEQAGYPHKPVRIIKKELVAA